MVMAMLVFAASWLTAHALHVLNQHMVTVRHDDNKWNLNVHVPIIGFYSSAESTIVELTPSCMYTTAWGTVYC